MKFAICQEPFENWDWLRQCRFIADVGYTGIELAPFTLAPRITDVSAQRRRVIRRQAEDHGLSICGLHWLLAKTQGLHLTTSDRSVRESTAKYLIELGRACADFGGTVMVFGSPLQRNRLPEVSREQALDNAAEVFRTALPAFADRGVTIALEPLTPLETNFINTCEEAVQLIDQVGHPSLVLHQDVKAMLSEPTPIPELIAKYAKNTGHFHVNDDNLLGPGMGRTDYRPIISALLESAYSGWVSVEVFDYRPGAEFIARESINYLKRILKEVQRSENVA